MNIVDSTAGILAAGTLLLAACPTDAAAQAATPKVYEECVACHSLKTGEHDVGPSLAGVVGRKAGTVEGFRFSAAMQRSGITWTRETLDRYIADPQVVVRGTRMPYSGMENAKDRAALIDYLQSAGK